MRTRKELKQDGANLPGDAKAFEPFAQSAYQSLKAIVDGDFAGIDTGKKKYKITTAGVALVKEVEKRCAALGFSSDDKKAVALINQVMAEMAI